MKNTTLRMFEKPKLREPVLIEGLPGMGHVGKLAVEHLVSELRAVKFAEIYSPYFPHQVTIQAGGIMRLLRNELHYATQGERGFIFWTGDVQPLASRGHYEVVERVLDVAWDLGVRTTITLGGFATGRYEDKKPSVIALGNPQLVQLAQQHGARAEIAGGPIIGAAGLLLALGQLRGMSGLCLLAETPGMMVDPGAATAVLQVLLPVLGIEVDLANLEHHARITRQMIKQLRREMERRILRERKPGEEEEPSYIG
jgi:hypothetical protein